MISGGPLQIMESMWESLPPLAVWSPVRDSTMAFYISLFFSWVGHLHRPLRAHPSVKSRRLRRNSPILLEADLSGYLLNTTSGPIGPDRPLGNYIWEASKLLFLVNNRPGPAQFHVTQPLAPTLGQGPLALCQGELFIWHPSASVG